jgi:hypothetical protein
MLECCSKVESWLTGEGREGEKGRGGNRARRRGDIFCVHTDTTGGHVCGYHDGTLAGLELVQHPVTLSLLFITMNA